MILFIDRLPLEGLFAFLPMMAVDPGRTAARPRTHKRWKVDTGCGPEAYAWRSHLLEAGLNPDSHPAGRGEIRPASGPAVERPRRRAHLLLFSNVPALQDSPFRFELTDGITLADDSGGGDPRERRPIVGMKALHAAGLQVLSALSAQAKTISVWVPKTFLPKARHRAALLVRRALTGFATTPIRWDD
jgi:hypothetical protein